MNIYLTETVQWTNVIVVTVKATDILHTLTPITLLDAKQLNNVIIVVTFSDIYLLQENSDVNQLKDEIVDGLIVLKVHEPIAIFVLNYMCGVNDQSCNLLFGLTKNDFHAHLSLLPAKPYLFNKKTHYQNLDNHNSNLLTLLFKEMIAYNVMERKYGPNYIVEEQVMSNIIKIYESIIFGNGHSNKNWYILGGVITLFFVFMLTAFLLRKYLTYLKKSNRTSECREMRPLTENENDNSMMLSQLEMKELSKSTTSSYSDNHISSTLHAPSTFASTLFSKSETSIPSNGDISDVESTVN